MIRINTTNIDLASTNYLNFVKTFFRYKEYKKLKNGNKKCVDKLINLYKKNKNLEFEMLRYFHLNLEKIILAKPEKFDDLNKDFIKTVKFREKDIIHQLQFDRFKERMKNYYNTFFQIKFDYKGEEISYGRWLSKEMNVNVCPYCNHNYIFTINENDNRIYTRPEFDHFYPKSKYPLLALSLYNLIPSCAVCNKIKGEHEISFNPYKNNCNEKVVFNIISDDKSLIKNPFEWITGTKKIMIDLEHSYNGIDRTDDSDNRNFVKRLGINKIYEEHVDYVEEIMSKIFAYNKDYYKVLSEDFKGLGKSPDQIDTIIWNAYLKENERRPMSRLTTDILKQFDVIK